MTTYQIYIITICTHVLLCIYGLCYYFIVLLFGYSAIFTAANVRNKLTVTVIVIVIVNVGRRQTQATTNR